MDKSLEQSERVRRFAAIFTNFEKFTARRRRAKSANSSVSSKTHTQFRNMLTEFNQIVEAYPTIEGNEAALYRTLSKLFRDANKRINPSPALQTKNPYGL